jgi:predicted house-cleaning noncanonical NTP pyrophosphatase (MazG superfamily)
MEIFMHTEYHKLVRDHIPDIIRNKGYTCDFEVVNEEEYQQELRKKLVEEACEVATAQGEDLVTELADLNEVMAALMKSYAISPVTVHIAQKRRHTERGGFEQRIRLLSVDE